MQKKVPLAKRCARAPDTVAPLPIGSARPHVGARGHSVPRALIVAALEQSGGMMWRALEYVRAHGFPMYAKRTLSTRIAGDPDLVELREQAAQSLVADAVDALRVAVRNGEDWAVRQVLNSPLAHDVQLGNDARPQVAVAVGAGILDPIDQAQRLARLDAALVRMSATLPGPAHNATDDDT